VFFASAAVSGLLGHAALLSCSQRPVGSEWSAPPSPELARSVDHGAERVALNGGADRVKSLHKQR
jgi:hypothetical protein